MLGVARYLLGDRAAWDAALAERNGHVNTCGTCDLHRRVRLVAA
jgi:hypothetical protein